MDLAVSRQGLIDNQVFEAAVNTTRMAMAVADPNLPDCPLVYVNPSFTTMTGYSLDEVVGRNCRFLQGPDTAPEAVAFIRNHLAAGEGFGHLEIYNYRKDGSGFWNALHISLVHDDAGKLLYLFASQIDISAAKEAARRQAQRVESMGALASGVAHEFNNLMTVVMGSVERAASDPSDDRLNLHLDRAGWAAKRAGQLSLELLSLAHRQASREQVSDLNAAVRSFEDALREAVNRNATIRLDLAPEPLLAKLDVTQLELVLLNLVRNASDAMTLEGEIVVSTSIMSSADAAAILNGRAGVSLSVADQGRGMPPEVQARATELFFTTKGAGKGTGVGLFLALEFVDHSGGKLTIESEVGQGTCVRLAFPQG